MADYDTALDFDPNNFMAHYNRGQLRMQLGDDNRAISDFDYVIKMEPENYLAIFNRALLHDRTGDIQAAIRDYTTVIEQFPNFWTGLSYRAQAYRKLGMTAKAELDEFKILKAQMDKHQGIQPRWSKNKRKAVRKRSEIDPNKYAEMVVADEAESTSEYKSEYRGKVQNRTVNAEFMPMYALSYFQYNNGVKSYQAFDKNVEEFNTRMRTGFRIYVACNPPQLTEADTRAFFNHIDTLSVSIAAVNKTGGVGRELLQRAVAYSVVQDYDAAIADLTTCMQMNGASPMCYWQRAVCQMMINDFDSTHGAPGAEVRANMLKVKEDFDKAIALEPNSPYLFYNRGNMYASQKVYANAIDDYTKAIALDGALAEAYYNRGLAHLRNGNKTQGIADLSKAGELGLYAAYSVIKQSGTGKE